MEKLIQELIDRLIALESEFDSLPDLSIIQELIKEIETLKQNETFTKETLKDAVTMFGNGYITTKSDELFTKLNETFNKLSDDNSSHTETKSSELSLKINGLFQEFKTDLNKRFYKELLDFKEKADEHQVKIDDMVKNALLDIKLKLRDVKNGRDGRDGKDGVGIEGKKGRDGIDGVNGVGIDDITYKSNTITIFLSNGTKKEIRLNIPISMGGGGGISQSRVMELISESLGNSIDAYTKEETDDLLQNKEDISNKSTDIPTDSTSNTKYPSVKAVADFVNSRISSIPIGSIIQMKTDFAPNGFLICDGTNITASSYSSEFLSYLASDFVINSSGFAKESEILDTSPISLGDITSILARDREDQSTSWVPNSMQSEYSFTIQLTEPTIITGYELFTAAGNNFKKYSFLGSNDGTNYTLINNQISRVPILSNAKIEKVFVNETSYLYYKFVFTPTPRTKERPAISYFILYIDASGEIIYTLPDPLDINPSHNYIYKYLIKAK